MACSSMRTSIYSAYEYVRRVWDSLQVELHGQYSLERMRQLQAYSSATSLLQVVLVILLTGVPCILVTLLLDCIPLQPPSTGLKHSQNFWLRGFVMVSFIHVTVLVQMRQFVPRFPITRLQILIISLLNGINGTSFAFAMSYCIGFPLPFTIAFGAPACMVGFAIFIGAGWGKLLKRNPDLRTELLNYIVVLYTQLSLIYVYPSFTYIFTNLSSTGQSVFSLFLPLPKILFKNWICYVVRNKEDFKPQVAIFNIEIFHALFVAISMQTAASPSTIVVMMTIDFAQNCVSLCDVNVVVTHLGQILAKARLNCSDSSSNGTNRQDPSLTPGEAQILADNDTLEPSVLDIALAITQFCENVQQDPRIRKKSAATSFRCPTVGFDVLTTNTVAAQILPRGASSRPAITKSSTRVHPESSSMEALFPRIRDAHRRAISAMSDGDRLEYVQQVLKLLHLTEFVLLVEFTEVIIPIGYNLYQVASFKLPNSEYNAQLKGITEARLLRNVSTILVYASLELVSFVALTHLLSRKLQVSPVHQLAFVLQTQWRLVQSKLMLWVVFSVQITLEHFGSDYSFQFKWLRGHRAS